MTATELLARYFPTPPTILRHIPLSRGDDDFREVYVVEGDLYTGAHTRLAVKHTANTFLDGDHLTGISALIEAYNALGIDCPRMVPDDTGSLYFRYTEDGRDYYLYAEEFARHKTFEEIEKDLGNNAKSILYTPDGRMCCSDDMLRALGRVGAAHLDVLRNPSAYCLLEPFCPPDTTDEQTECAELFFAHIREHIPAFAAEAAELRTIFYRNREALRAVYPTLPTSCFQADLNFSNLLLDENHHFVGLIDFNLAGREPVLNYALRECMWATGDDDIRMEGETDIPYYDPAAEARYRRRLMDNLAIVGETYPYSATERAAFPILLRYMDSIWWGTVRELERVQDDPARVRALLDYLRRHMTQDDLRL